MLVACFLLDLYEGDALSIYAFSAHFSGYDDRIADHIVVADLAAVLAQNAGVAHPVRQMMRQPRATLRPIVIGTGGTDICCKVILPVDALRHIGNAESVRNAKTGVLAQLFVGELGQWSTRY